MKKNIQANDINAVINYTDKNENRINLIARVSSALATGAPHSQLVESAAAARAAEIDAENIVKKIPLARRNAAKNNIKQAKEIALAAAMLGGNYSGVCNYVVKWGSVASAYTLTGQGDRYSRGCSYSKTDADHVVVLDAAGVAELVKNDALRRLSDADGLPLIALYQDGAAVWVKTKSKQIVSEAGWVMFSDDVCYHSTESLAHARAGLAKKLAAAAVEKARNLLTKKQNRRARLIARLCNGAVATVADAEKMGYCSPGIRQFQSRFGINDTATLPELIKTGNESAVKLALQLARKISKN